MKILYIALFPLMFFISSINAATIKIPADQPTIQSGINAAMKGDTVLVSPGTYNESIDFKGKEILLTSTFILAGDTSCISKTIIKGYSNAPVITFVTNEDSLSVLTGFTITGGGGGILCLNSKPTILYNTITHNTSPDYGGGIYLTNSSPQLSNLTVSSNSSPFDGGGIYCTNSNPAITNLIVSGNYSFGGDGGGMYFNSNSNAKVQNVSVINNASGWYGGGIVCNNSVPLLDSLIISGNKSYSNYGGGIYCVQASPVIKNTIITHNTVSSSVGPGSGGGGIACMYGSIPFLSNVTIARNSVAGVGGGIYIDDNSCSVIFDTTKRCNIYLNDGNKGYDIYSYSTRINVVVDTFTVLNPTNLRAYPLYNYTFNILNAKITGNLSSVYVSPKGDNSNSGMSWASPFKTIKFALSLINGTPQEQATVYIDSGSYSSSTNGDIFELNLGSYTTLKGSGANKTILDGANSATVLIIGSSEGVRVEDLTITNGSYLGIGGGIGCGESSAVFKNLIISNCTGSSQGGGIYLSSSNVSFINTLFINNHSGYRGGAICGIFSNIDLVNVTLINNTSDQIGGGIACSSSSVINILNSIFWNNGPSQVYFDSLYADCSLNIAYSDFQNGLDRIVSKGNNTVNWVDSTILQSDPLLNNYYIPNNSPCIGAGINQFNFNGNWLYSPSDDIEKNLRPYPSSSLPDMGAYENPLDHPTLIFEDKTSVSEFKLSQNYPNPFNPTTTINYSLPKAGNIKLIVYNALGSKIVTILNEYKSAGNYSVQFNGINLPSGIYFYKLEAGQLSQVKKMMLIK